MVEWLKIQKLFLNKIDSFLKAPVQEIEILPNKPLVNLKSSLTRS